MHQKPTESYPKYSRPESAQHPHPHHTSQYGGLHQQPQSLPALVALPAESLTHITSFLDPVSLLSLGQTNMQLYRHVKDDNTWHRAFVFQFLGIIPEDDLQGRRSLMLRRTESTWRKEFTLRWKLRRRWERSRTPTVAHAPLHSHVSGVLLISENALLSSSLLYGIVARSIPLTGKVLKGYIDATGVQNGAGIGNPNAQFTPNVSACALAAEGGTARVLWGYRNGEVATSISESVMVVTRPAAKFTRCSLADQHKTEVKEVVWATGGAFCASGDIEGVVKVWETKTMKCIWSSKKKEGVLVTSPCTKIALDVAHGVIAAGMMDGEIAIWTGLGSPLVEQASALDVMELRITPPRPPPTDPFQAEQSQECAFLSLDARSPSHIWALASHRNDPCAYRLEIDVSRKGATRTAFGDDSSIAVTSILPSIASRSGEQSFVVVGDQLGYVHIYDWSSLARSGLVSAYRSFEAHQDGAVTALAATPGVLVSGSAGGTTRVWDMLSLTSLCTIAAPSIPRSAEAESVSQIAAIQDMLTIVVGKQVVAWKAGPVSYHVGKVPMRNGKKGKKEPKGHRQYELARDIKESSKLIEHEQAYTKRAYGREREQRNALEGLGLSEVEAVEYALMLSRDEEENRRALSALDISQGNTDEGMFQTDFEEAFDMPTPVVEPANLSWSIPRTPVTPSSSTSAGRPSPPMTRSPSVASVLSDHSYYARSQPRNVPGMPDSRIQVSPRLRPEPMEAGFGGTSPISLPPAPPAGDDTGHFPPMSRTPSSTGTSTPSTPGSSMRRSVSGSPDYARIARGGAWNTGASAPGTPGTSYSEAAGRASASSSPRAQRVVKRAPILAQTKSEPLGNGAAAAPLSVPRSQHAWAREGTVAEQDEDEDLRYAIELSLAEARSRGEKV